MLVPGQELSGVEDGEVVDKEVAGEGLDMVEAKEAGEEVVGEGVNEAVVDGEVAKEDGADKPVGCVRRQTATDLWTHSM
jgi:hypothetical protein